MAASEFHSRSMQRYDQLLITRTRARDDAICEVWNVGSENGTVLFEATPEAVLRHNLASVLRRMGDENPMCDQMTDQY